MTMNFMYSSLAPSATFLVGFALQMGGSGGAAVLALAALRWIPCDNPRLGGILGYKGFMLNGTYDAGIYALFFFQMVV
jgi:Amt family ammonium transporter